MTGRHATPASVATPDADLTRLLQTEDRLAAVLRTAETEAAGLLTAARLETEQMETAATEALARDLAAKEVALRAEGEAALVALRDRIAAQRARLGSIDPLPLARRVIARLIEPGLETS